MTQVNKERMLAEFKEIVALPCHSLQERPVFELLKGKLEALGFTVEEDDAGEKLGGNCGIWYSDGIYYVDHSIRITTKKEALAIGRKYSQISIWGWKTQKLVYC